MHWKHTYNCIYLHLCCGTATVFFLLPPSKPPLSRGIWAFSIGEPDETFDSGPRILR